MASVMDLILRVMGSSGQFREDMEQDKVVLDDFVNSVHDLNIDVNLDDADAQAKLDEFRASLDELHNAHADIKIDDAEAKRKVDSIRRKLDEIRTASADVKIDDVDAKEKIDELKRKLDEVKNESLAIKLNDIDAKAKLDALKERLDSLHQKTVDVEVDSADARVKLDDIKEKLDTVRDAHSKIDVDDAEAILRIDELDRKLDGLEARIETVNHTPIKPREDNRGVNGADAGAGGGLLVGSILTLLPSISPLAAVAAGAIGSIGGAFGAATAGVAGFGIVAKGVMSDVKTQAAAVAKAQQGVASAQNQVNKAESQLKAAKTYQQWLVASEKLAKAQQVLAQATAGVNSAQASEGTTISNFESTLNDFQDFWSSYVKSFESPVLQTFTLGLRGAQTILQRMRPVISNAASAINELLREFDHDLGDSSSASFFRTLARTTGPAILAFGRGAANIFSGLAGIFRAFAPTFADVDKGWTTMTVHFAEWGQQLGRSNSFRKFLEYVRQETPEVLSLIGNLATLVVKLLESMAPAGALVLLVVNGVLKLVNALLSVNPIIGQTGGAIMVAIGVMKLLGPVITGVLTAIRFFAVAFLGASEEAGTAILGMSGPIGWIIAAVVAAVILIVSHWKQVSAVARTVWKDVAGFFVALGQDIERIWNGIIAWFDGLWTRISAFFRKWGPDILLALAPFIAIPLLIFQHFGAIESWFSSMWNRVVARVRTFGSEIRTAVETIGKAIGDYFSGLARDAVSWGENIIHSLVVGIEHMAGAVASAVSNVVSSIGNFLGLGSQAGASAGSNLMTSVVNNIQAGAATVHSDLNSVRVPNSVSRMVHETRRQPTTTSNNIAIHYHQNAPVYGVNDLNAAIQKGVQSGLSGFVHRVKATGRSMGVSN